MSPRARKISEEERPLPYEALVAQLEATVERLEAGGLTLEEALTAHAEGVRLAAQCQALLDAAEQRIRELREGGA